MNNNKLFTGFFFGVIFGLLAVFLFGTKQGKKVSKKLTKEGIGRVEDWKKVLTAELDDELTDKKEKKLSPRTKKLN